MINQNSIIRLIAVGDIALNGRYDSLLKTNGPQFPCAKLVPFWSDADLIIGNLESPITRANRMEPSKCTLRGSQLAGEVLRQSGISVLSLANNHMMDYGAEGLAETTEHLDRYGLLHLGGGSNKEHAGAPLIIERHGQTIGLLSFCDVSQSSPLYATTSEAGVNRLIECECLESIRCIRERVDWLIVNLHWGTEMALIPSPEQRNLAKALVDGGADVILGHHPHVMQPTESFGNAVVFYSLGNFLFSDMYWRGANPSGENFASKLRLHPLSRMTCWAEIILAPRQRVSTRVHAALLNRNLSVSPDNRSCRVTKMLLQENRLSKYGYFEEFQCELAAAKKRTAWRWAWRPIHRRLELTLFTHGLLRHAVEGT